LKFARVNTQSAVLKTAIVHNLIDELQLDCLAMTETWIKQSHPDIIKHDPTPPRYAIFHIHLQHLSTSPNYNTSQSAYRALHSTETAMTKVVNDLLSAVDSGKPTVLLSLNINAAFKMLDHDRLLNRTTELFGLSGQVIDWLESYSTGRTSYVSVANCSSSTVYCRTGAPQGSVLEP